MAIAAAGEEVESANPAPPGLGQLLIQDAQSGSPARLDVARYHVHVVLQPPVALVQIDQSFYNPFGRQQEGQFIFNLPPGASVSRFAMYVSPTELIEGELVERQRAATIYDSIVRRQRDPAILEQLGDNLFKMRVFPIFACDEKRILLDFTLPLEPQAGRYQFRLPLLSDLIPIWDLRISGVVRAAVRPASAASVSHPEMEFESRQDGSVEFRWQKNNVRPETDLVVTFAERADRPATLRSFVAEPLPAPASGRDQRPQDDGSQRTAMYFLAEIPPTADAAESPAPESADVLVLADTSSSIKDFAAVRRTVREIVRSLRVEDRVRVLCIDVAPRPLHDGWLQSDDTSALERLDDEFCLGKTDLDACLRAAVQEFHGGPERRRLAIYVGDGADEAAPITGPAGKQMVPAWLQESGVTLVAVGVQRAESKTGYLRSLVEAGGGLWFDLAGAVGAGDALARWLRAGLPSPERIADVSVEGADAADLFCAGAWLPGEPLYVYGRMPEATEVQLRLTLERGRERFARDWTLPVVRNEDDVFVGRLWAQRQLDRFRQRDESSDQTREAIVALSREWSLLSPPTAFLVLESEADYPRWGLDRQVRRRYWKPAEARPDVPLPPEWVRQFQRQQAVESLEQDFATAIHAAREALKAKDYAESHRLLRSVAETLQAGTSAEFQDLHQQTLDGLRARAAATPGPRGLPRGLLDPAAFAAGPVWQASVTTLLGSAFRADPEFLRRHPYADRLLQEVELSTFAHGLTLEQFAARLAELTGANVCLDRRALEDIGIRPGMHLDGARWDGKPTPPARFVQDDPFADQRGGTPALARRAAWGSAGRISLRGGTRLLLRQFGLDFVEQPHRLLITTPDEAESRLGTEVYPIADLLFTDQTTPLWLLTHPYLDRQEHVRQRLESKLERQVTIECRERPLADVLLDLAAMLNDTVWMDHRALDDVGIDAQAPVTASIRDVPAKQALEWILRDVGLEYTLHEEALIVTTPEVAESRLEVRLHPARGVLWEYPAVATERRRGMGGMGGMAGFGGGMGGAFGSGMAGGTFGGPPPPSSVWHGMGAGLSSGGDSDTGPREATQGPARFDAARDTSSPTPVPVPAPPGGPLAEPQYVPDSDTLLDVITSTIAPQAWDIVGGPGCMEFFPYSLDLVLAQTRDVQERVTELLDRLRRLPAQVPARSGGRPATIASLRLEDVESPDLDTLIDVIATTIGPVTWDDVGGPGSIVSEPTRAALVVSQTAEMQDEVAKLLTMLRRSRYETLHGSQPWEAAGDSGWHPAAAMIAGQQNDAPPRLSEYPAAGRAGLETLLVRCQPGVGQWRWRRVERSGTSHEIVLRLDGRRLECQLPACVVRSEDDAAAVAWRDLRLAELGSFAESLHRTVDVYLPWLPHRSNEELARVFDVFEVRDGDVHQTDGAGDPSYGEAVWVRMVPAGLGRDGGTYLQIAYSHADGAPVAWESYVGGQRTGRIRFSGAMQDAEKRARWTAVLEDAQGQERVRWELTEFQAESGAIPPPTEPFGGFVHLDRRAERPVIDAPLAEALTALRQFDWSGAMDQLRRLPDDRARHPLVLLLQAWCLENDRRLGPRDRLVGHLFEVAQSGVPELLRFVTPGHFPSLSAAERYAILSLQNEATRTAEDWDRLADAAVAAGNEAQALRHVEAALERGGPGAGQTARCRRRVELLLRLGRAAEAVEAARQWSGAADRGPDEWASLAELLARHGQREPADELFASAMQAAPLVAADRYALLRRWAAVRQGVARCEKLIEAAALHPAGSPERRECMDLVRRELAAAAQADAAGQLARTAADADLAAALVFLQAELTPDVTQAAGLLWQLYEAQQLGEARLASACQVWNAAGQAALVIQTCEAVLRAGRRLSPAAAAELANAYRAAGRQLDARRAASRDPQPAPPAAPAPRGGPGGMRGGFF